mmetsp:Transcript_20500/g.51965  ORF Transcript_20500/g.51965 Transcript_20500/m.51965 type:complete len:228 (-) Transcript_20500:545-1228(-)
MGPLCGCGWAACCRATRWRRSTAWPRWPTAHTYPLRSCRMYCRQQTTSCRARTRSAPPWYAMLTGPACWPMAWQQGHHQARRAGGNAPDAHMRRTLSGRRWRLTRSAASVRWLSSRWTAGWTMAGSPPRAGHAHLNLPQQLVAALSMLFPLDTELYSSPLLPSKKGLCRYGGTNMVNCVMPQLWTTPCRCLWCGTRRPGVGYMSTWNRLAPRWLSGSALCTQLPEQQ